jgi:hypothetical protein
MMVKSRKAGNSPAQVPSIREEADSKHRYRTTKLQIVLHSTQHLETGTTVDEVLCIIVDNYCMVY